MVLKCGRARGAAACTERKERANLSFNIERFWNGTVLLCVAEILHDVRVLRRYCQLEWQTHKDNAVDRPVNALPPKKVLTLDFREEARFL